MFGWLVEIAHSGYNPGMGRLIVYGFLIAGMVGYWMACKWAVTALVAAYGVAAMLGMVFLFGVACYLAACEIERRDQRASG